MCIYSVEPVLPRHMLSHGWSLFGCRSAPLAVKYAAEVAQVITNSRQQAASFEHKPQTAAAAAAGGTFAPAAAASPNALSPSSSSGLGLGPAISPTAAGLSQPGGSTAVGPLATAGVPPSTGGTGTTEAASTPSSLPVAAVVSSATGPMNQQSHWQQQQEERQQAETHSQIAADTQQALTIRPKTLKPITVARGSSAFGMSQPKRPALAQGPSMPQPLHDTPTLQMSSSPSSTPAVLTHPAVSQQASLVGGEPDVQALLLSADNDAQAAAVLGAVAAAPSTAGLPSTAASGQPSVAAAQNPSAMGSAVTEQPRAVLQIRAAAGGLFGAAAALGTSAASGLAGTSPVEPDLAAVRRLRAQLTLPFAVAPVEGQSPGTKAGKRQQPERQNRHGEADSIDRQGNEGSASEGIRAVVDALQAEKPYDDADAVQPAAKKQKGDSAGLFMMFWYKRFHFNDLTFLLLGVSSCQSGDDWWQC